MRLKKIIWSVGLATFLTNVAYIVFRSPALPHDIRLGLNIVSFSGLLISWPLGIFVWSRYPERDAVHMIALVALVWLGFFWASVYVMLFTLQMNLSGSPLPIDSGGLPTRPGSTGTADEVSSNAASPGVEES